MSGKNGIYHELHRYMDGEKIMECTGMKSALKLFTPKELVKYEQLQK